MKHDMTWWRPDGWLRLIYGVWANQLWYWQHVRPLLDDPRQRKRIFVQAVLGTIVVTLVLSLIPIYILTTVGTKAGVTWMFAGALVAPILNAEIDVHRLKDDPNVVTNSVFLGMGLGLTWSIGLGLHAGFSDGIRRGVIEGAGLGLAIGLATGIGYGVWTGLVNSTGWSVSIRLILLAFGFTLFCIGLDAFHLTGVIAAFIVSIVLAFPAAHLGNRWAIRQVPDEETRKQLANPEGEAESR